MDLNNIAPDHFIRAWEKGGGVTARAAELLQAMGHGRHRLGAIEAHVELLRSRGRGLRLRPLVRRGRFIPENEFLSAAWERYRLIGQREDRKIKKLERLMKPFCTTWEASPDVETAVEVWRLRTGKTVGRLPFRKLAAYYRRQGVSLKRMD